jgi:hypothetical protein
MEGLLATAIKSEGVTRPPPNCTGAASSHPTYGSREPLVGSAKDPGADQAWVQSLCPNGGQVYAAPAGQGAVSRLAFVYQAALLSNMGLRLPLRPDDLLPDALLPYPYHYTGTVQFDWVAHLGPIYVATLVFVAGALLALRGMTRRG